jgi:hypothetical protein
MKTNLVILAFAIAGVAAYLHASTKQPQGYQTATVVSVEQLDLTPQFVGANPSDAPSEPEEFAYNIGLKLNCTVYTGRYESATDYLPIWFKPDHNVDVRLDKHWIYVSLPSDREVKLGIVNHRAVHDETCAR